MFDGVLMAALFFLAIDHNGGGAVADHHPIKAGVILLTDRVKFVIVATGARHREGHGGLAHHIHLIVGESHQFLIGVHHPKTKRVHPQMCGTNGRFVDVGFFIESGLRQQIAGQMLDHQLVVWDILLQGPYQIITVLLGKGDTRIALAAMTFAVAVPVHPVSGPTFRIRLAGQQSVDVFFIALRIFARRKPCHVVR